MPSRQKLSRESGADKWSQQRRAMPATPRWRCPFPQHTGDIWVLWLWEDALLTGWELSPEHTPFPAQGSGHCKRWHRPEPGEQAGSASPVKQH